MWLTWTIALTVWGIGGPAFCWYAGKAAGSDETRRAILHHPSLSRRRTSTGSAQAIDGMQRGA